ncbi:10990_t:CDS:2, partial [Dentiscutata erythropus]
STLSDEHESNDEVNSVASQNIDDLLPSILATPTDQHHETDILSEKYSNSNDKMNSVASSNQYYSEYAISDVDDIDSVDDIEDVDDIKDVESDDNEQNEQDDHEEKNELEDSYSKNLCQKVYYQLAKTVLL